MSSAPPRDRAAVLVEHMLRGIGADGNELAAVLGLSAGAEDFRVARALVQSLTDLGLRDVSIDRERRIDPRGSVNPPKVAAIDSSFLGQLGNSEVAVAAIDDVRTLVAVMRAGTLAQRRAAALRLRDRVAEGRGIPGDQLRWATSALTSARDDELAYELWEARAVLPGSVGRQARAEREEWDQMVQEVARRVTSYWREEAMTEEPIAALPGEQRASFLVRVRDMPDLIVAHLSAILEGTAGETERRAREEMLSSLRYAGDPRLVPALASILLAGESEMMEHAARALGRIRDPRTSSVLAHAFQRTVLPAPRMILSGALALAGDLCGAADVRDALDDEDPIVLRAALEALEATGTPEDVPKVVEYLGHADPLVVTQAVRTLARVGDSRAHHALSATLDQTSTSAGRAEIEDALAAIRARMELRGEEPAKEEIKPARAPEHLLLTTGDPALTRLVGEWDYLMGRMWLIVGARRRAIARFEAAAENRPGWGMPVIAMALTYMQLTQYTQALAVFRRAVEVDRPRLEGHGAAMAALLRCFLRRAEEMEREGRQDIARGLLEEALALDLRRAPSALRFEVRRLHDALRARLGHD